MPQRSLPLSFYLLLVCGLLAANVTIYRTILAPHVLEIRVLDVGEAKTAKGGSPGTPQSGVLRGSATLVRTPRGKTILIDTGPDAGVLRALGNALPMWQRRIDAIILTGTNAQFTGGLPEVDHRYHVATVIRLGTREVSYGSSLTFETNIQITVIAPGVFSVSRGASSFLISSSTQPKSYVLR